MYMTPQNTVEIGQEELATIVRYVVQSESSKYVAIRKLSEFFGIRPCHAACLVEAARLDPVVKEIRRLGPELNAAQSARGSNSDIPHLGLA